MRSQPKKVSRKKIGVLVFLAALFVLSVLISLSPQVKAATPPTIPTKNKPQLVQDQNFNYRILPHVIGGAQTDTFVTSGGNYTFSHAYPFLANYTSLQGNKSVTFSTFAVLESGLPLLPGTSTVIESGTTYAVNTTLKSFGGSVHGYLTQAYNFSSLPAKITATYKKIVGGSFNVAWLVGGYDFIYTSPCGTPVQASSKNVLASLSSISRIYLSSISSTTNCHNSLLLDASDYAKTYGPPDILYGRFAFNGKIYSLTLVKFATGITVIDPSLVQSSITIGTASSKTCTLNSAPLVVGDVIIVGAYVAYESTTPTITTVTDTKGNTFTAQARVASSGHSVDEAGAIFTAPVTNGGSGDTITITVGTTWDIVAVCASFSGLTSATEDSSSTGTGTYDSSSKSFTLSVGSFTPPSNNDMVYQVTGAMACGWNPASPPGPLFSSFLTPPAGFTNIAGVTADYGNDTPVCNTALGYSFAERIDANYQAVAASNTSLTIIQPVQSSTAITAAGVTVGWVDLAISLPAPVTLVTIINPQALNIVYVSNGVTQPASTASSIIVDSNTNIMVTGTITVTWKIVGTAEYLYDVGQGSGGIQLMSTSSISNIQWVNSNPLTPFLKFNKAVVPTGIVPPLAVETYGYIPPDTGLVFQVAYNGGIQYSGLQCLTTFNNNNNLVSENNVCDYNPSEWDFTRNPGGGPTPGGGAGPQPSAITGGGGGSAISVSNPLSFIATVTQTVTSTYLGVPIATTTNTFLIPGGLTILGGILGLIFVPYLIRKSTGQTLDLHSNTPHRPKTQGDRIDQGKTVGYRYTAKTRGEKIGLGRRVGHNIKRPKTRGKRTDKTF